MVIKKKTERFRKNRRVVEKTEVFKTKKIKKIKKISKIKKVCKVKREPLGSVYHGTEAEILYNQSSFPFQIRLQELKLNSYR